MKIAYSITIFFSLILLSCNNTYTTKRVDRTRLLKSYILEELETLQLAVDEMATSTDLERARVFFTRAHQALKKVEPFLVYLDRKKMIGVNGPPLPVYREDNGKVLPPIGFQSIEEQLFSDEPFDQSL